MTRSVKNYVAGLNEYIFVPGLQREFVWNPSQIANLFDSLIRNYPIGILTEWDVRSGNVERFNSYQFLEKYIVEKGHPPEEISDAGFSRYNFPMGDDVTPEILIIDGQQRLNALYIGICGHIAEYRGGKGLPRDDLSNWQKKALCIDLFAHPDFSGEDVRGDYEFRFRRVDGFGRTAKIGYDRVGREHHLWMPVGDLWNTEEGGLANRQEMSEIVKEYIDEAQIPVDESTRARLRNIGNTVVRDLYSEVLTTELKNDTVDHETSVIPEVFQRLNTEGEDPKPYQLLMSRLMSYWPYADMENKRINPREQVEKWLDRFCRDFPEYEHSINRDLFMRYSMFLIKHDLLNNQIKNLSEKDMDDLRNKWLGGGQAATYGRFEWFRDSLAKVFEIIIDAGLRRKVIDNIPLFALIGEFFYYNPNAKANSSNRNEIFQFISLCLLLNESHLVLSIDNVRSWMRYLHDRQGEYEIFPGDELLAHEDLSPATQNIRIVVENAQYSDRPGQTVFSNQNVAAILGLVDDAYTKDSSRDITDYDVDHIFPLSKSKEVREAVGNEVELNRIGNLQLLYNTHNREKRDMWPGEWFESISPAEASHIQRINQYPDVSLEPDMAEEFITAREYQLIDYLEDKYVK